MPRQLTRIDPRIAEALQEIGTIVENDLGLPYDAIARALEVMAAITRNVGESRTQREAGNIALALRMEASREKMIASLPEGALWS